MSRNQSLDVLRGIAILMVICCHYPLIWWMQYGYYGVDLFFVLSGFLISGLLFSELAASGTIDIKRFLIRRGFKIYPGFYVFVIVICLLASSLRPWFLIEASFLQSYIVPVGTPLGHTWSLAVEEHFYLLLPFVVVALNRLRQLRLIPLISVVLLVACAIMRSFSQHKYATHLRIDELFLGVAIRYVFNIRGWELPRTRFRLLEPLSRIGFYSYSVYLWHTIPARFMHNTTPTPLGLLVYASSSIAIGILMAKAVELPMLHVRDRLFPTRRSRNSSASAPLIARTPVLPQTADIDLLCSQ